MGELKFMQTSLPTPRKVPSEQTERFSARLKRTLSKLIQVIYLQAGGERVEVKLSPVQYMPGKEDVLGMRSVPIGLWRK